MVPLGLKFPFPTPVMMPSVSYTHLPGRTAFSIYRFDKRDKVILLWICLCGSLLVCGGLAGGLSWRYYPTVKGVPLTPVTIGLFLGWAGLCLTPMMINVYADHVWNSLHDKETET